MNYDQAVRYLLTLGRELASPQQAQRREIRSRKHYRAGRAAWAIPNARIASVHIAGTNGKGSTAAMLASILARGRLAHRALHVAAPAAHQRTHARRTERRSPTPISPTRLHASMRRSRSCWRRGGSGGSPDFFRMRHRHGLRLFCASREWISPSSKWAWAAGWIPPT